MVYRRIWEAWKKENKSADVIWHHGQQPMEMHTEVTLLCNLEYNTIWFISHSPLRIFSELIYKWINPMV